MADENLTEEDKEYFRIEKRLEDAYQPIIDKLDKHSILECYIADMIKDFELYYASTDTDSETGLRSFVRTNKDYSELVDLLTSKMTQCHLIVCIYFNYLEHLDELKDPNVIADSSDLDKYESTLTKVDEIAGDNFDADANIKTVDQSYRGEMYRKYDGKDTVLNAILKRVDLYSLQEIQQLFIALCRPHRSFISFLKLYHG